jgi:tetratricopeptide (TPR) repeat protein
VTALRALLVIALVVLAAASPAHAEKKKKQHGAGLHKNVAEKLLAAYDLLQKEKLDESLAIVDGLAEKKLTPPELAQVHRFRGYIYVNKGTNDRAVAEFEQSLATHALDPEATQVMTYSMAQIYTQLGKYDRALELIDGWFAAQADPKPDAYYLKAMILVQQEKYDLALEPAKLAIEKSDSPKESWVQLLVAIYSQKRDYPNVAATLQRLVAMSPGNKKYWVQLSAVLNYLQRDEEALASLRLADETKLLGEDPELRQLSRLLFVRDAPFQCAREMEAGLASGAVKPDAEAYRLLSNCYIAARESDKALEPLEKAAALSTDGEVYLLLGQMHLQRERYASAIDAFEKALSHAKPERRAPVHLLLGVAQLGADRFDDAEREFRAAQGDAKTRAAAESYLKYTAEERARQDQKKTLRLASSGASGD